MVRFYGCIRVHCFEKFWCQLAIVFLWSVRFPLHPFGGGGRGGKPLSTAVGLSARCFGGGGTGNNNAYLATVSMLVTQKTIQKKRL